MGAIITYKRRRCSKKLRAEQDQLVSQNVRRCLPHCYHRAQGEEVLIEEYPKPKRELRPRGVILLLPGCSVFAIPALLIDRRDRAKGG